MVIIFIRGQFDAAPVKNNIGTYYTVQILHLAGINWQTVVGRTNKK